MLGAAIHPGDTETAISAWDLFTPLIAGLVIALWPTRQQTLRSFWRTFALSAALSFLVYALTIAVHYVLTFVGAIISAGISAIGLLTQSQLDSVLDFATRPLLWLFIIGAQLLYVWRAVRWKRQGEFTS
jgi:hypothetical protein